MDGHYKVTLPGETERIIVVPIDKIIVVNNNIWTNNPIPTNELTFTADEPNGFPSIHSSTVAYEHLPVLMPEPSTWVMMLLGSLSWDLLFERGGTHLEPGVAS